MSSDETAMESVHEDSLRTTYRLTPLQEGMLFHQLAAPRSGANIEQVLMRLHETLDASRLLAAFNRALARHDILHTRFVWRAGEAPRQEVLERAELPAQVLDLSDLPDPEREERLAVLIASARAHDFDLSCAPQTLLSLVRISDNEHVVLWTFHHILLDRRSLSLVLSEVFDDYDGVALPAAAEARFSAFVHTLPSAPSPATRAYYGDLLAGFVARTPLEVGFCAREGVKPEPRRVEQRLSAELTARFVTAAMRLEVSPQTLFEAAWALLLMRYSQSSDVVFGAARDGRTAELSATVGLLINTVPVRARTGAHETIAQFARALELQSRERAPHEQVSLSDIQQMSQVPAGTPLFETLTSFEARSLEWEMKERGSRFVQRDFLYLWQTGFPLTVVGHLDDELLVRIGFDPARYDAATVTGILTHTLGLLTQLCTAPPRTPLSELSVLSETERAQLIDGFNQTDGGYPDRLRLHELFEAQVARAPNAVAAVCRGQTLRYQELESQANRLAHWLKAQEVGPDVKVAICLPRSLDMVVSMIAVLKAGGAYVPLDPAYPEERIRFMLEDSAARLVLTVESLLARLPQGASKLFCLDSNRVELEAQPETRPSCDASPDDLAYIIYTSGSTGQPKGVVVRHRPAVNLIDWVNTTFSVGPADRLLFVTSICFDLSVYDVFGVLGSGGSLHIATSDELREPRLLVELLKSGTITFWDSAPAALMQLVPLLPQRHVQSRLRLVLLSGDWIPVPLPDQVRGAFPTTQIVSLGGATEATIWSNYYVIGDVPRHWPSIPYGRPIRNARYYVLSEALEPLPIGVPGQLHIGGLCLADGYLNRPELSAEKFIDNPFAPGSLYRTGDLARFMPDGQIEFLGRIDQQVKVRGFRIELGEIESVLNQHELVATSLVDAPRLSGEERTLVAYIVAKDQAPDIAALRALCGQKLPEYMVPQHFVLLPELPVTANGKVDRRALPAPSAQAGTAFVSPRSAVETVVAEVLASNLGVARVGVYDNFFELGGHSLLAVRVIGELSRVFEYEIALSAFLLEPTVAALAALLTTRPQSSSRVSDAIVPAPDAEPVVSREQSRLAFVQSLHPNSAIYNICLGFRLQGSVDGALLERALRVIVERHEPLRTVFKPSAQGYVASILSDVSIPLEQIDLTSLPEQDKEARLAQAMRDVSGVAFNLAKAPLMRAQLVRLEADAHALLIIVHHVVFDGPSSAILLRELLTAYDALARGEPVSFAPLPIRFNDVARWQLRRVEEHDYSRDLTYWRQRLAGPLPVLQLPHDRPRPRVFSHRGGVQAWRLPDADCVALRRIAQTQKSSLFTLLLASFSTLLHRYSGQSDILVAIPVAAREQPETRELIGLLLNTLVIRSEFTPQLSFDELLQQVRTRFLEALEHRELPFEQLVADLNPPRDPAITPIFQAFFSYEETSGRVRQSEHFEVSSMVVDQLFAGTELSLFVEDSAEHGIHGYFEYSSDLFEPSTIARIVEGFLALLGQIAQQPTSDVDRLPVMSPRERSEQLVDHNQTQADFDLTRSVVALFEAQAVNHPGRIALRSGNQTLSYAELLEREQELAAKLAKAGAGPGKGVAIFLERSPRLLVSLLAVLRTGAYYIPLDPSHPGERNLRILRTATPSLLLVEHATHAALPAGHEVSTFDLDASASELAPAELAIGARPDGIAYVIFTSGSTGDPKGVEIPHRALTNFLCSMAQKFGLNTDDRLLALTTISFDIAGLELYLPLVTGASVEIAGRAIALDPRALAERLRAHAITMLQATPATFRMLIEDGWRGEPQLKVLCGGEAFPPELARALVPRVKSVWNMYGPTETTVWSSLDQVRADDSVLSIGHPIHNTQMYVLNDALEPVPRGVAGMLYIGGAGVACGYYRRPDLTSAAFLKDTFSADDKARLYRTGDLARRLPDGRLECLGRTDFQVKIRGYRIELGEVEAALSSYPGVLHAVTHVYASTAGDKQLVGYVVLSDHGTAVPEGLLEHIRSKLPSYMVPNVLMALAALPLTANGKVDRKALPEPVVEASRDAWSGTPEDDTELKVLEIFTRLLGRDGLSTDDNFFELGGHSLLAVRLIREVNTAFALDLSVGVVFEQPTAHGLSSVVRSGGGHLGEAVVPLHPGSGQPPLFFLCGINLYQRLASRLGSRQPSYGVFVPAEEEFLRTHGEPGSMSIEQLAVQYVNGIRARCPEGPYAIAGVSFGGLLAFETARQLRAAGEPVSLLILLDSIMPWALHRNGRKWLGYHLSQLRERGLRHAVARVRNRLEHRLDSGRQQERQNDELWEEVLRGPATQSYFAGRPRYDGPTLIVRASDRSELVGFDIAADLGWGECLSTAPVEIVDAPGTHLGMLQRRETAKLVRRCLAAASGSPLRPSTPPAPGAPLDSAGVPPAGTRFQPRAPEH